MEVKQLGFMGMLSYFQVVIPGITDPRSASNATRYSLKDAILGAFAAFFRQNESFLEYQRQLNSRCGRDNAQSLFGLVNIPTVEQMRNILDGIAAKHLFPLFRWIDQGLGDQGYLRLFAALDGNLLVALDATHYYSSEKISCPCCSSRTSKQGKITYQIRRKVKLAKDLVYQAAKNALIKDNWLITHDLYTISFGGVNMAVDLGAEKLIAATKDHQKIAVEIKSFLEGSSAISEFHTALGQFINYRAVLKRKDPDRVLFLAIPSFTYDTFFSLDFTQLMIRENHLKLIIFSPNQEVILTWIN